MINLCISGGQSGADIGGLKAAKDCGIATGGWLPKGCITLDGPKFEYLELYNMKECEKVGYVTRTELNVKEAAATFRFASNFNSQGEKATLNAIKWYNKPFLDVDITKPRSKQEVIDWIKSNQFKILNIAGNSEKTSPGIEKFVYNYLVDVFKELKRGLNAN